MTVVTVGDEQIESAFKREDQMCLGYTSYSAPFRYKIHVLISSMHEYDTCVEALTIPCNPSGPAIKHPFNVPFKYGYNAMRPQLYNWQFTLSGKFPQQVHLTSPSLY